MLLQINSKPINYFILQNSDEFCLYSFKIGIVSYKNSPVNFCINKLNNYLNTLQFKLKNTIIYHKKLLEVQKNGNFNLLTQLINGNQIPEINIWNNILKQILYIKNVTINENNIPAILKMLAYTSNQYDKTLILLSKNLKNKHNTICFKMDKFELIEFNYNYTTLNYNPYSGSEIQKQNFNKIIFLNKYANIDWLKQDSNSIILITYNFITEELYNKVLSNLNLPYFQKSLGLTKENKYLNTKNISVPLLKEHIINVIIEQFNNIILTKIKKAFILYSNSELNINWQMISENVIDQIHTRKNTISILIQVIKNLN